MMAAEAVLEDVTQFYLQHLFAGRIDSSYLIPSHTSTQHTRAPDTHTAYTHLTYMPRACPHPSSCPKYMPHLHVV